MRRLELSLERLGGARRVSDAARALVAPRRRSSERPRWPRVAVGGFAIDLVGCEAECDKAPTCQSFTFNAGMNACFLKEKSYHNQPKTVREPHTHTSHAHAGRAHSL